MRDFFLKYKKINYRDKEIILRAEDNPQGVYYVNRGYVRMDVVFENGSEVTFNIFKPGSFFPAFWAISDVDNTYNFTAMGKVEVYRAPKDEFLKYLKSDPRSLFDLIQRILIGIDGLLAGVQNIIKGTAKEKMAWTISMLEKRKINLKLTHQDIARLAAISRETASVEIKKLERKKAISFRKGLLKILKPKELLSQEQ